MPRRESLRPMRESKTLPCLEQSAKRLIAAMIERTDLFRAACGGGGSAISPSLRRDLRRRASDVRVQFPTRC